MTALSFKAACRPDDRWTVLDVVTGESILPSRLEERGIASQEAVLLAAMLNTFETQDANVSDGRTWKAQ